VLSQNAKMKRLERNRHHRAIPVQIRSIDGRCMPSKDPNIANHKPNSKKAIQGHFEVFHKYLNPAK
jgi:hypothetical protein